jgi:hypothetical protein
MYFEVAIPSADPLDTCVAVTSTDFESFAIPLPPLGFRPGTQDNLYLRFNSVAESEQYAQILYDHSLAKEVCAAKKFRTISSALHQELLCQRMAEQLNNQKFLAVGSNVTWHFRYGNNLTISGPVLNQVASKLATRNDRVYLETSPTLFGEPLEIQDRADFQIELITEFTRVLKVVLQKVAE